MKNVISIDDKTPFDTSEGLLILLQLKGVGPVNALSMSQNFKNVSDLLTVNRNIEMFTLDEALEKANKILKECQKFNIRLVSHFSNEYPVLLKKIPQPAPLLYVKGELRSDNKYIACVGTREPTDVGVKTAKFTTNYFVKKGWSIVSGLALGVDSICHEEALRIGGHTVAILANGLDTVSPKSNAKLAEKILAHKGALVSEYPPGFPVYPRNLVIRDRLQSGFSVATVPMQTGIKGGTLHTINFSFIQNRNVVVPVHPNPDEKSMGLKYLLDICRDFSSQNGKDPIFPDLKKELVMPLRSENLEEIESVLSRAHLKLSTHEVEEMKQMRLI